MLIRQTNKVRLFDYLLRWARPLLPPRSFGLGIEGLPHTFASLQSGQLYGVAVERALFRQRLLGRFIAEALLQSPVCVLATDTVMLGEVLSALTCAQEADPASFAELSLVGNDRLRMLQFVPEMLAHLSELPAQSFSDELDVLAVPIDSVVVILDAEKLFSWQRPQLAVAQGMAWRLWMERRRNVGLLIFSEDIDAAEVNPGYLDGSFAGLTRLKSTFGRSSWKIEYWGTSEGAIVGREFDLSFNQDKQVFRTYGSEIAYNDGRVVTAPDQNTIYLTRRALDAAASIGTGWFICESYDEMLVQARQAVAAAVVLDFSSHHSFEALCRTVHALRLSSGRGLRIIVRECSVSLRYTQELLLLRLGADLVAPVNLSFSRLLANIVMMRGQVFSRGIEEDFHRAVEAALPITAKGYMPFSRFCAAVRSSLDNSVRIELPCALVRFSLRRDLPHLDALRSCHIKRSGDLFSTDSHNFFLFLFACPETDIASAVSRLFSRPLGELFDNEVRYIDRDLIFNVLVEQPGRGDETDFSGEIALITLTDTDPSESESESSLLEPAPLSVQSALFTHSADSSIVLGPLSSAIRQVSAFPLPRRTLALSEGESNA